jgi:molybdenum cofactor guanylyltransferase
VSAAGIVLCGGNSRRMGRPKHLLPFGHETMLERVVRLVSEVVRPVLVVATASTSLPANTMPGVLVARDRVPDLGPLEGIAVGLAALGSESETAFVTACDAPLLRPALVRRLLDFAEGNDLVVPHVDGYDHPLSGVYRTSVLPCVDRLLAARRLRPAYLFDLVRTRRVTAEELVDLDAELESLLNLNTPADYLAALKRAGIERP